MSKAWLCAFALVAASAASLLPAARAQPGSDVESMRRGGALVTRDCGGCHAVSATGDSPNPEAPPFRDLHQRYPVENLAEALAEGIITGHPRMPEFRFSPREVSDIIAYLQSIQTHQHSQAHRPARSG